MKKSRLDELLSTVPTQSKGALADFLTLSEARVGGGASVEARLLETLALTYSMRLRPN